MDILPVVALLQGIAGWFAGIFLLVFQGMLFEPDDPASILFLGVLLPGVWMNRRERPEEGR